MQVTTGLTSGVTAISVGAGFACAISGGQQIAWWGYNRSKRLGDGVAIRAGTTIGAPSQGAQNCSRRRCDPLAALESAFMILAGPVVGATPRHDQELRCVIVDFR